MLHELNMDKTDDKEKIQINFEAFKKKKNPSKAREKTDKNKTAKEGQGYIFTDEIKTDRKYICMKYVST